MAGLNLSNTLPGVKCAIFSAAARTKLSLKKQSIDYRVLSAHRLIRLRKVCCGTGVLAVRLGKMEVCANDGGGRGRPPHQTFQVLRVGARPMRDCPETSG